MQEEAGPTASIECCVPKTFTNAAGRPIVICESQSITAGSHRWSFLSRSFSSWGTRDAVCEGADGVSTDSAERTPPDGAHLTLPPTWGYRPPWLRRPAQSANRYGSSTGVDSEVRPATCPPALLPLISTAGKTTGLPVVGSYSGFTDALGHMLFLS